MALTKLQPFNLDSAQNYVFNTVSATQLVSTVATGTAPFVVTSTTPVANLSVGSSSTSGTVTTAAQPNITSVGTLATLSLQAI